MRLGAGVRARNAVALRPGAPPPEDFRCAGRHRPLRSVSYRSPPPLGHAAPRLKPASPRALLRRTPGPPPLFHQAPVISPFLKPEPRRLLRRIGCRAAVSIAARATPASSSVISRFSAGFAPSITSYKLALRRRFGVVGRRGRERRADALLVELCDLPARGRCAGRRTPPPYPAKC